MRRSLILAAALGITALGAPAVQAAEYPGGAEGCVATTAPGGTPTCKMTTKRDGGYVADGQWKLAITRAGKTVTLTDKTHKGGVCATALKKGDKIVVTAVNGRIAAGNPFPAGTPSTGGTPGDYKACKK